MTVKEKTSWADPWQETDVIDKRAVRFSQGITAALALLGILISPWFWLAMAIQLALGLTLGRKWCLPCLVYYFFVQPRWGQGELEDARAPRFANVIGFIFLSFAFLSSELISPLLGDLLAALVALLALLASSTGFCLGCWLYRFLAHLRGVRQWQGERVDKEDFAAPGEILFWHPLCSDCQTWKNDLPEAQTVDISKNPGLAKKYGVLVVPTVYEIDREGKIVKQLAP